MFYLLIALTPLNCMQSSNLWLYAATLFYWVVTLTPATPVDSSTDTNDPR